MAWPGIAEACGSWQNLAQGLRKQACKYLCARCAWHTGSLACKLKLWPCAPRKSRLISHRDNVNPFGASFLNYVTALKLTEVTIDATTFVEMEGSFETDLPVRNSRRVRVL